MEPKVSPLKRTYDQISETVKNYTDKLCKRSQEKRPQDNNDADEDGEIDC